VRRVLAGLVLRRILFRTSVWGFGLFFVTASVVTSYETLYPDPLVRAGLTESVLANPSFRALLGVPGDLSTAGGFTAWRTGLFLGILAALYGGLTVVALTRGEEEAGLRELVWSGAVRRQAPLTVATTGTGIGCLLLGGMVTCALVGTGATGTGAVLLGAGVAAIGLVFVAVGAVAAEVAGTRRAASALTGTLLAVAYVVRMVADTADDRAWLGWLSPLGWLERIDAYGADRPGPVLLALGVAAAVFAVAYVLEGRRDLGAGLLAARQGPAGSRWIRTPETLAARVYAATVLGWVVGVALLGAMVAAIAADVAGFVGQDEQTTQLIARLGGPGDLARSYLSGTFQFIGILVVVVAVEGALRARREEAAGRAEPVLALPVPRARWLGGFLTAGVAGAVCTAAAAGLAGAAAAATRTGVDPGGVLAAALNTLPAAVCFAGLTCALVGLFPRVATSVGLGVPVVLFLVEYFGRLLDVPQTALAVSPFHYVALVPTEPVDLVGAAGLVLAGGVLAVVGLVAVQRRDIVPA
jgi:ABC-2 type transport system permease protein